MLCLIIILLLLHKYYTTNHYIFLLLTTNCASIIHAKCTVLGGFKIDYTAVGTRTGLHIVCTCYINPEWLQGIQDQTEQLR